MNEETIQMKDGEAVRMSRHVSPEKTARANPAPRHAAQSGKHVAEGGVSGAAPRKRPASGKNGKKAAARRRKARQRRNRRIAIAVLVLVILGIALAIGGRGRRTPEDVTSTPAPVSTEAPAEAVTEQPVQTATEQSADTATEAPAPEPTFEPTSVPAAAPASEAEFAAYTSRGLELTSDAAPSALPYRIHVSKDSYTIAILGVDESGEYTRVLRTFRTAIGTGNKTRAGTYEIDKKYDWYSWSLGGYTPFTCRLSGSKIRLHAPLHNENEDWNSLYREGYREIGTKATQGCLRTTCQGAAWVYFNCDLGTQVVIGNDALYESENPPELGSSHSDPTRPTSLNDLEIPVTFFALNTQALSLSAGGQAAIAVEKVAPEFDGDRRFVFVSGDENVATVDENGVVTAVGVGSTRLLVVADDINGVYRFVDVTVGAAN